MIAVKDDGMPEDANRPLVCRRVEPSRPEVLHLFVVLAIELIEIGHHLPMSLRGGWWLSRRCWSAVPKPSQPWQSPNRVEQKSTESQQPARRTKCKDRVWHGCWKYVQEKPFESNSHAQKDHKVPRLFCKIIIQPDGTQRYADHGDAHPKQQR